MDMDMSSSVSCNTSMLWNWQTVDSCFLSETWHVSSNGIFAASCIGTILLVIILEALRRLGKEYDDWIVRGFQAGAASLSDAFPTQPAALKGKDGSVTKGGIETTRAVRRNRREVVFRASPLQQVIRSVIHAVALGLAYIIMLIVMSYNGYIIICVIIGGGLGKFFCDWMTKRVLVGLGDDDDDVGEEEKSAGIEEPSMCCG